MIEIRIHGRGGQGGVTLAKIIAASRFLQGKSVQAFGLYAAERSGAPIQAFCRYDDEPIANRNLIYMPDHVIVLDPTLVGPDIATGLDADGWIIVNSPQSPESFAGQFPGRRVATVDATTIARENGLGTRSLPIVNTALAGAAGRVLGIEPDEIHAALAHLGFGGANHTAASRACETVRLYKGGNGAREAVAPAPAPAGVGHSFVEGAGGDPPAIRTGSWASERPHRRQMIPPCNHVCPAGNHVQDFLQALARDQVDHALEILLDTTPFPSVCGRACPAPCMNACNRLDLDGAVNVRELERYAGDHGQAAVAPNAQRDEHVAVVGSGPAGLTGAYHLARFGYRVTVYESGPEIGGLLRTGIPGFRLPDEVVDREIGRVLGLGVEVVTGHRIDRGELLSLARRHDAMLVATGLQELRGLRLGIDDANAVIQGIDFLDRAHAGKASAGGEDVIVVGGGNTAIDAARTALRLGANSVRVVYRRSRAEMPAIAEEIDEALEEGIALDALVQPVGLRDTGADARGPRYRLTCKKTRLTEPDTSGRRTPVEIEGSEHELECHRVILALGQSPDVSVFPEGTEVREGRELLGLLETPVFAVGDLATHEGTVAAAIGSGRRAAVQVHNALSGEHVVITERAEARRDVDEWSDEVMRADGMKLHLFERHPARHGAVLPAAQRRSSFDEIHAGLPDAQEAARCLSCGVCNECDLCTTYCPEGVLKRVGHEFVFDYSFCKGCGVCVAECPRSVILMSHL